MKKNQNNINIKLSKIDEILTRSSIIPVMVIEDYRVALNASEALLKGGVSVIEITLRTPNAFKVAEKVLSKFPEIKVYPINMEPPNKLRVRDFLKDIGVVSLNTYFDPKLDLVKLFKMRGLPTSILIDKNGDEFGRVVGEIDFYSEEFINLLKKYI